MDEQERERYELFRRAILLRDEQAWATIHAHYRPLLVSWARRCSNRVCIAESADDIADRALARAWVALTPASFIAFPTLGKLLAYLRTCVRATVIDQAREQASHQRTAQSLERPFEASTPEQAVLRELDRGEIWRLIMQITSSPEERIIVHESLVYALPPREIQARHPDMFADVAEVYRLKRNLINRFQRNHDLQRLWRDSGVS